MKPKIGGSRDEPQMFYFSPATRMSLDLFAFFGAAAVSRQFEKLDAEEGLSEAEQAQLVVVNQLGLLIQQRAVSFENKGFLQASQTTLEQLFCELDAVNKNGRTLFELIFDLGPPIPYGRA